LAGEEMSFGDRIKSYEFSLVKELINHEDLKWYFLGFAKD
jgi:hypothetical protein